MWDVIVVGARCAGATAALRFARSGRSVLVVDKAKLGSDTLSTHILVSTALARLSELGVLEVVKATGAPPLRTLLAEFNDRSFPTYFSEEYDLSVRRITLDPLLVTAAEQAGATVRHQTRVEKLVWEDERVVGVSIRDSAGKETIERARLVVGADGRHSRVAQEVKASEYNIVECTSAACYAYWRGIGPSTAGDEVLQFADGPECDVLCAPCDGGLWIVLLIFKGELFEQMRQDNGKLYEETLRTVPTFAPRFVKAQRVGKLYPASAKELRGYFRKPFGAGWALAGDAGYYAHPASAGGISDALRSGELVHTLVERAWAEDKPAETYLDEYQRVRDAENTEAFYFSYRLSQINPFTDAGVAAAFSGGLA